MPVNFNESATLDQKIEAIQKKYAELNNAEQEAGENAKATEVLKNEPVREKLQTELTNLQSQKDSLTTVEVT